MLSLRAFLSLRCKEDVMKAGIVLCILLCLASIVWGADRGVLDQADTLSNQGRYDEAIAAYSAIIRAEPTNIRAYVELGVVYGKQGRYDEAITVLREAAKLKPDDIRSQHVLGAAYLQKGLQREALAALNEALRLAKARRESEFVPLIEAMLRDIQPKGPPTPTPAPPEKFKLTVRVVPAGS